MSATAEMRGCMAKLVFVMNVSLDGYVDHTEFGPRPALVRHFVVEVDPSARRVRLHDPAAWRVPAGATVVPLVFVDGHAKWMLRDAIYTGTDLANGDAATTNRQAYYYLYNK